jgi:hypothetical protein
MLSGSMRIGSCESPPQAVNDAVINTAATLAGHFEH